MIQMTITKGVLDASLDPRKKNRDCEFRKWQQRTCKHDSIAPLLTHTMTLQEWLEKNGAKGLDHLVLEEFPETGRGIKTLRALKAGDEILTIPGAVLWTVDAANTDPLLGPILRSLDPPLSVEETLAVFLLFIKARDTGYEERKLHTEVLPTHYTASIFFDDDELEVCAGSSLYGVTKQLKQQIKSEYMITLDRLFVKHPEVFPLHKFTLEEYSWALCTIWSRAMDFKLPEKQFRLIAPFADMLNHSLGVKTCHVYDQRTGVLRVLADNDYKARDQVFINYGPVPNNRLLRLYGFVLPNNPHDSYELVLTTHHLAPFYDQKVALFIAAKLDVNSTFSLTLTEPLPDKVLQYLRIQRSTSQELTTILATANAASKPVTARNEAEILTALDEALENLLAGFAVSIEELGLRVAGDQYPVGGNAWAAAHVSMGEQRILRLALAATRDRQVLVVCARCGKAEDGNKKCGRCKKVVYCSVDCQKAHHKEHKGSCKSPQ
ncbi:hypothetical protein BC936DRAFT_143374 [Jimgerdemannia flammicorona]|uniref:MYND-type domain-containing protein n=1 Tax=Jimgerdemannia flammicorona TaxID=994334 RepID=A0A433DDZ5_9FUNG|nr:hypothetical protein BC936DRAFT_143374 [Jimgerdemannia flammicorona]